MHRGSVSALAVPRDLSLGLRPSSGHWHWPLPGQWQRQRLSVPITATGIVRSSASEEADNKDPLYFHLVIPGGCSSVSSLWPKIFSMYDLRFCCDIRRCTHYRLYYTMRATCPRAHQRCAAYQVQRLVVSSFEMCSS